MSDEKKKSNEEIEGIESSIEETPQGIRKNLKVNCSIKCKNFKVNAGKIRLKFPVEIAEKNIIEKRDENVTDTSAQIFKGGQEIELKNVHVKEGKITINIPMLVQEILSIRRKEK
ncbi:MAG: hypothetical protein QMD06_01005 [Candidatus Altarchaeum sp.]|nr:hypothetical protein [Candidatus Altarchaeum sp.]